MLTQFALVRAQTSLHSCLTVLFCAISPSLSSVFLPTFSWTTTCCFFWPASIFHSPVFFFSFFWLRRCSTSACFLHWPCCPQPPPPIVPLLLSCATPAVLSALVVMCLSMSVAPSVENARRSNVITLSEGVYLSSLMTILWYKKRKKNDITVLPRQEASLAINSQLLEEKHMSSAEQPCRRSFHWGSRMVLL